MKELIEEMVKAGSDLQEYYDGLEEKGSKFKSYILNVSNSLKAGNKDMFIKLVNNQYKNMGKEVPIRDILEKMMNDDEIFRVLGYAYVVGMKGNVVKK